LGYCGEGVAALDCILADEGAGDLVFHLRHGGRATVVVKFLCERRIELRRMFNCELSCYTGHILEDCGLLMDRPKTSLVPISILPLFTTMANRLKSTTVLDLAGA
jgi:hypothetical protein